MNEITLDWNKYCDLARQVSAEGCVLLKNTGSVLPYKKGTEIALFGRIQNHYYKSGTGSGGMVNVDKVVTIPEALKEAGFTLNKKLEDTYTEWEKTNPYEEGYGWGKELWSQKEMQLTEDFVTQIAAQTQTAAIVIGRTAGEDRDNGNKPGSWLLSDEEKQMIKLVRKAFKSVTVIFNTGNIMDMSFIDEYNPDAVILAWQGGMIGAYGLADILSGKVSPSGKLSDTIAKSIEDYPSHKNFGDAARNIYEEDIYVGYRYFETFAKDKVLFPFGFGLSYSTFSLKTNTFNYTGSGEDLKVSFSVDVTNTGKVPAKETVQVYVQPPQGKLGKPLRNLIAFKKTMELKPAETQTLEFGIDWKTFASFDDTGKTGNKSCFVLEAGEYVFYVGTDVRSAPKATSHELKDLVVTEKLHQALAPVVSFSRFKPQEKNGTISLSNDKVEAVKPYQKAHRLENLPNVKARYKSVRPVTGGKQPTLKDVADGKITLKQFLSYLTDDDLACIIRGEGMGSPKVTPGTAAAFGGVSPHLKELGVPCVCCDDGPSGMRLDSGVHAFSLPNGTMIASTFNPELISELYYCTGLEMTYQKVDVLLGPGMNIHRYPLNGRNFEYFSEDPYLTGICGGAVIDGLHRAGTFGSMKHFCANNQEFARHEADAVVSERALREIYLKGYEMCIKNNDAQVIMTTYAPVNSIWTSGNYDLDTLITREEWGFKGFLMTDWWAKINAEGEEAGHDDFATMTKAQNDVYMVCPDGAKNEHKDNTEESLKNGTIDRAELLRNAENIIGFAMKTHAFRRLTGTASNVSIINRKDSEGGESLDNVQYYRVTKDSVISFDSVLSKKGTTHVFGITVDNPGIYNVEITAKADQGELAQIPVSIFFNGILCATVTWNGTNGKWDSKNMKALLFSKHSVIKLYFAQSGLVIKDIHFTFKEPPRPLTDF